MHALPLLALFACGVATAAPRVTIELLPEVQVNGDAVCLGEVAHLQSPDLALMRKLVVLPIGRAPRAGEPAGVQRDALAQWLRREAALAPDDVEWLGADSARITRSTRQVRGQEIAGAAAEALQAWLGVQGIAADLQPRPLPRDVDAPAAPIRLQVRPLDHLPLRERMVVWVELWNESAFVRAVPVSFLVTQRPMPLAGGAPLPLHMASRLPGGDAPLLVARGDWATLRSSAGVVTLESRVEVLQDGHAGQRVRVRSQGATGIVFARVVGPAQLELVP